MSERARIESGAAVEATDGRFGTVQEALVSAGTGEVSYLLVRHGGDVLILPGAEIAEVTSPVEVRLRSTREAARAHAVGKTVQEDGKTQFRIPVYEERLRVETRPVDLGEVRLHKYVEHVEQIENHAVEREEVEIERVRLDRPIDAPAQTRQEDGWLVVPVMEEVLVISRQLILAEEVRIRTRRVVEEQPVRETLRREHVAVEDATRTGVRGLDSDPTATQTGLGADTRLDTRPD